MPPSDMEAGLIAASVAVSNASANEVPREPDFTHLEGRAVSAA